MKLAWTAVVTLALFSMITGCSRSDGGHGSIYAEEKYHASSAPSVDPDSVSELAKTVPSLQKACDIVGSCEFLVWDCAKYEDGKRIWTIRVPGAGWNDPLNGYGVSSVSLDAAAASFVEDVRRRKAETAYRSTHPEPKQPKYVGPCDGDCQ